MSALPKPLLTEEEYLEIESRAEYRSAFFAGEMFAMAGASLTHNLLVANMIAQLHQQLRQRPCQVYASDLRVKVRPTGLYTYPDLTVVCGTPLLERETLLNPVLIAEVLSDATEGYDRGAKFRQYQHLDSLRAYLLVSQVRAQVEQYERQEDGSWRYTVAEGREAMLPVPVLEVVLSLAEVYDKVVFDAAGEGTPENPDG